MESPTDEGKTRPWNSFQTFWNFLEDVASKPLPPKLDRSMMTSKSGTDQSNLVAAMQMFGLIDNESRVQLRLETFVAADAEGRKSMLADWIRANYGPALRISAENGTSQDLVNVFRDELGMTGADTRRKAITFFQHAAQQAGLELSPHFPKTRTGSGAPGTPRPKRTGGKRKTKNPDSETQLRQQGTTPSGHTQTVKLKSGGVVTLTYDVNMFTWSDEDEAFVLDLIKKLRKYPADATGAEGEEEGDET